MKCKIFAKVGDKKYPVCDQYIEDGIAYFFTGKKAWTGEFMAGFIEDEAQDECWYNWRTGSEFLWCEFCFLPRPVEEFDEAEIQEFLDVYEIEVTDKEIILVCEEK